MKYDLDDYELNLDMSIRELRYFGDFTDDGYFSIKYAYGNFIGFNPNTGECVYQDFSTDYINLRNKKIEKLIKAGVIKKKGE